MSDYDYLSPEAKTLVDKAITKASKTNNTATEREGKIAVTARPYKNGIMWNHTDAGRKFEGWKQDLDSTGKPI